MTNKKSSRSKSRWLDRSLIVNPYCYALCLSKKEFNYELNRLGLKKSQRPNFLADNNCSATIHFLRNLNNKQNCAIICIDNDIDADELQIYSLLTHEAVHLWQHIKECMGEVNVSKEFEAYSIQGIAQNLMYSYKEQNDK